MPQIATQRLRVMQCGIQGGGEAAQVRRTRQRLLLCRQCRVLCCCSGTHQLVGRIVEQRILREQLLVACAHKLLHGSGGGRGRSSS